MRDATNSGSTSILAILAAVVMLLGPASAARAQPAVTDSLELGRLLARDCAENPGALNLYTIGKSGAGKPIYLVRVTAAPTDRSLAASTRLLVICRQHGDEPVSTEAALDWLAGCANAKHGGLARRLGATSVYLVPMANPDGADKLNRLTGSSGDMNRDWGRFALPETRAVYAAFRQIAPDAVIDMHSWDATDPFQANSLEAGLVLGLQDSHRAGAAVAMQRSMIATIRRETGQAVSALSYSPDADARLCHRFFAARGVPAVLVETAAGPSGSRAAMQPRVQYDLAALGGAIAAVPSVAVGSSGVADSRYVASADALAGRVITRTVAVAARPRFSAAQLAGSRRAAVRLALGLYCLACLVLAVAGKDLFEAAWRRLLARRSPQASRGYVSIRARRYPASARDAAGELLSASVMSQTKAIRCR